VCLFAAALLAGCDRGKSVEQNIRDGEAHHAAGDIPAALIDMRNALQQDPKNVKARVLIGELYLEVPDGQAAEAALLRAKQDGADWAAVLKPLTEAELLLGKPQAVLSDTESSDGLPPKLKVSVMAARGEALLALGRVEEAGQTLQAALAHNPHSVDVLTALARLALARNDRSAARERLAQATTEDPGSMAAWSLEGILTFSDGDFTASERAYQRILDTRRWNLSARLGIARAQIAAGKLDAAAATLAEVLKAAPANANANYLAALLAYRQRRFVDAQTLVQHTLSVAGDFPSGLLLAGASDLALKRYEQANVYLRRYVQLVPQNLEARKLLAIVEVQLGEATEAVKTLSPAVAQGSNDPQLLALVGVASARTGDLAAADRYLTLALSQRPDDVDLRTQLGITQLARGELAAAADELERASRDDPHALRPDVVLVLTYLRGGEFDKALRAAKRVQERQPGDPAGFDLAGLVLLAKGDDEAARTSLLQARQLRPDGVLALNLLAALELRQGRTSAARGYYREVLRVDPKNAAASVALAKLDIEGGRAAEALATLRAALQGDQSVAVFGRLLLAEGRTGEALDAAKTALAKSPRDPDLLEILGRAQLGTGDAEAAKGTFETLAGVRPAGGTAHRYLAEADVALHHGDLAAAEARKAIDLDPRDEAARKLLARIYLSERAYADARPLIEELAAKQPKDSEVAALQGDLAMALGSPEEAAAAFQRGLALAPSSALQLRLARAQMQSGHGDAAEQSLRSWIAARPEDAAARLALADVYMARNRLNDAAEQYRAVAEKDPDNAVAENNYAWALSQTGHEVEALEHARRAASLRPNAPEVMDTLGVVLLQNHRGADAVDALQKAAALGPGNPDVQLHLAQALAAVGRREEARSLLRALMSATNGSPARRAQAQALLRDLGG
jgi:putative PEP-CTERM system TPR-repeat lipoprotein